MIVPVQMYFSPLSKCQSMPSREPDINEMLDWEAKMMIDVCADWWPVHVFSVPVLPSLSLLKHQGPSLPSLQERLWLWWPGCERRWRWRWREMCNPSQHKAWDQRHLLSSQVSLPALLRQMVVFCSGLWVSQWGLQTSSADLRLSTFYRESLLATRNWVLVINVIFFIFY